MLTAPHASGCAGPAPVMMGADPFGFDKLGYYQV